jgi:hypothetical protein
VEVDGRKERLEYLQITQGKVLELKELLDKCVEQWAGGDVPITNEQLVIVVLATEVIAAKAAAFLDGRGVRMADAFPVPADSFLQQEAKWKP